MLRAVASHWHSFIWSLLNMQCVEQSAQIRCPKWTDGGGGSISTLRERLFSFQLFSKSQPAGEQKWARLCNALNI